MGSGEGIGAVKFIGASLIISVATLLAVFFLDIFTHVVFHHGLSLGPISSRMPSASQLWQAPEINIYGIYGSIASHAALMPTDSPPVEIRLTHYP